MRLMTFGATWVDLESIILSEVSQTEGEVLSDIPYMWNLKRNKTSEFTFKIETHRLRKWAYDRRGGGMVSELGIGVYTLL